LTVVRRTFPQIQRPERTDADARQPVPVRLKEIYQLRECLGRLRSRYLLLPNDFSRAAADGADEFGAACFDGAIEWFDAKTPSG
jgi:hypothetical protein